MKSKLVSLSVVSALGFAASAASAQVLMLDFGANPNGAPSAGNLTNSPYHTAAGSGFTDTGWNQVRLADITSGLVFSTGNPATNVSVDLGRNSTTGTVISLASQPASELPGTAVTTGIYAGNSIARDGIFGTTTTNPVIGLQISDLSTGTYDVYITARNTNTGNNQATYSQNVYLGKTATDTGSFDYAGYSTAGLTYTGSASQQTTFVDSWVQGQNYVKLSISITAGEFLNIAVAGLNSSDQLDRGFLNSVQIVNTTIVPEPSSFAALAGLGALGLIAIRRRRVVR